MSLRLSTTAEMPLQASKWLTIPVLIDSSEMANLFSHLSDFFLYFCGGVTPLNQGAFSKEDFLSHYSSYIDTLKAGQLPDPATYLRWFSPAMTATPDSLYVVPLPNDKQLIRIAKPVVQLQANAIDYSPFDKKFRPMVFGKDNIPWGIQFSYPQQYLDSHTKQVIELKNDPKNLNTLLFRKLQQWIRQETVPTPFIVANELQNVPIRLGKQCLSWINHHPQLIIKGISVKL